MENIVTVKKKKTLALAGIGAGVLLCALLVFLIGAAGRTAGRLADQLELGQKYLDELDYEQAFAAFEAALKIDPRSQEAYLGLAETYAAMGDLDRAAATLEEGYEKTGSEEIARRLAEGKNLLAENSGGDTDSDSAGMPDAAENQDLTGTGGAGTWDEAGSQAQAGNSGGDTDSGNQGTWAPMPEDHVMDWKDANLEAAMREITGIVEGDMMLSDVWYYSSLTLSDAQIRDISALGELRNITSLILDHNQISDITSIAGLTRLKRLEIYDNQIRDITPLAGLTELEILEIFDNQIVDLSSLSELTKLTWLSAGGNQITELSPLTSLVNLVELGLEDNQITDITPLESLTGLTNLSISSNQITDVSPLAGLSRLSILNLNENEITDVSALSALTGLKELYLYGNPVNDVSPVSFVETLRYD